MKLIHLSCLLGLTVFAHAEAPKFELRDGDRVLLLGDALLERENTLGFLEARMHAAWPQTKFTVRNLAWSGDTPKGWSRASFDGPAKGYERLKEQIALVKPTVVFLGYGMAASLQEMTDRSNDIMLNRDAARYGEVPMSAPRFKKELGELMTDIEAGGDKPRFVLMSPIQHEDLRGDPANPRPGTVDPTRHNEILKGYISATEELAKERAARFVKLAERWIDGPGITTTDGIHLDDGGYRLVCSFVIPPALGWSAQISSRGDELVPAILRKNDLWFHRTRPANSTYLFGFRKHEQGKNAVEIPQYDPMVDKVDAEIDALKRGKAPAKEAAKPADVAVAQPPQPIPNFTMEEGYEITLWADTKLVGKPVGMNWDAAGRLWVACSPVYPMIAPGAHPEDKVVVIEDTDHDGKADKSTTFATNLLIAAGVAPSSTAVPAVGPAGVPPAQTGGTPIVPTGGTPVLQSAAYVGSSTEIVRVTDTDGDGVADQRRTVLSGFGTEDTHHTVHTLKWGPDGRLYFNQSIYIHSHLETPYGMVRVNSGAIMAYDPRTERTEVIAKGWCNPWGHVWDEWGQQFTTDGAGGQGISWLVPGAMYFTYENAKKIMPSISPGSYPKFCGLELVRSPLFPAEWQGNAITCDFRAHRIARFSIKDLSPAKSGYETKAEADLVRTTDASFRPIDVKMGPDGALYVADWTNPVINHGEVDFRDPRRDHVNGRIWRIAPKGKEPLKWESLVGKKVEGIVNDLFSSNHWSIEQSRRILRSRQQDEWQLYALEKRDKLSGIPRDHADLESIWLAEPAVGFFAHSQSKNEPIEINWVFDPKQGVAEQSTYAGWHRVATENPASRAIFTRQFGPALNLASAFQKGMRYTQLLEAPIWTKAANEGDELVAEHDRITAKIRSLTRDLDRKLHGSTDADQSASELNKSKELQLGVENRLRQIAHAVRPIGLGDKNKTATQLEKSSTAESPRVRLEAMRALSRIPTAESAALVLEAAVNGGNAAALPAGPTGQFANSTAAADADTHYAYAAWLSVNDLAPQVMEYVEKLAADPANAAKHQAEISFALQALPADKTGPLLSQIVAKNGVPKDGSGPWIELIGQSGGVAECDILLKGLLANTTPDGDNPPPFAPKKFAFTTEAANKRAAAALVVAARRGVKPTPPRWNFVIWAPREAKADLYRLVGLCGGDIPRVLADLASSKRPEETAAIFEALRTLATKDAAYVLSSFLDPELAKDDEGVFFKDTIKAATPDMRRSALGALAAFRPDDALKYLDRVLGESKEAATLVLWRELFTSEKFTAAFLAKPPAKLSDPDIALRAARELGKKGEKLIAALTPLAGAAANAVAATVDMPALVKATALGNPMEGEAIYRRLALACTACHAVGGAGGKVGPDMTTIGASAPIDYIVESLFVPNAKVKEGYNAIALTLKGGRAASGVLLRETAEAVFLRDAAGNETSVPKADITARENVGSIMPAGLINALTDKEKASLFAFLSQLGKPGPFDATKATVARVWWLYPGKDVEAVVSGKMATPGAKTLTNVDGRLPKAALTDALQMVPEPGDMVVAVAKFAGAGKTRLNLQGVTKAYLDGAPLAIASNPSPEVELTAGNHTLVVKLDTKQLPEALRAECPEGRFVTE